MADIVFSILTIVSIIAAFYCLISLWEQCSLGKIDKISTGFISLAIISFSLLILFLYMLKEVDARDLGQWSNQDPKEKQWYEHLMQPDHPNVSCCGQADAYWCDEYYARNGKAYCKITDNRDDKPLMRPHIDIGTEFEIPSYKLKYSDGNPTGHAIIFLSQSRYVWCFVQNGGV